MVVRIIILIVFSVIMIPSCKNKNSTNIVAKGIVLDSASGQPIPAAKVTLLCWRRMNYGEETYDKVDTITDKQGRFGAEFSEGFKLEVGSIASGYHPVIQAIKDLSKTSNIRLLLKVNSASGELKDLGELGIFTRTYKTKDAKPVEYYGIDILNGKNTRFHDSIDIAISDVESGQSQLLTSSEKGGLIPIFDSTDTETAPLNGYMKKYKLNGTENGFFVRCRDGKSYSRLKIFALKYNRSFPSPGGHAEDAGIMFNVELQTKGNEFNTADDFRLDYYILKNI
jgi:hypothetical protein